MQHGRQVLHNVDHLLLPTAAADAQPEADTFCGCQVPVWASYLGIGNPTIPSILNCCITTRRKGAIRRHYRWHRSERGSCKWHCRSATLLPEARAVVSRGGMGSESRKWLSDDGDRTRAQSPDTAGRRPKWAARSSGFMGQVAGQSISVRCDVSQLCTMRNVHLCCIHDTTTTNTGRGFNGS